MASAYLSKTPASAGNRKTFTISVWVKRSTFAKYGRLLASYVSDTQRDESFFHETTQKFYFESVNSSSQVCNIVTTRVFRDTAAWYHMVIAVDTTQGTAADRVKIYVNGVQETAFDTSTYPSQNYDFNINNNILHYIGRSGYNSGTNSYFDGQMAHFNFVDGTALTPSSFGSTDSTTGEWKPVSTPSVTYGTNGFFLKFDNSANMGLDSGGGSNNYTVSGTLLQYKDTPSNVMPQLNHNDKFAAAITNAGQTVTNENNNGTGVMSTMAVATGKWYWEAKVVDSNNDYFNVGIRKTGLDNYGGAGWPYSTDGWVYAVDGNIYNGGSSILNTGTTATVGDIIGFILDLDAGTLKLQKNGSDIYSGNAVVSSLNTGDFYHIVQGASDSKVDFNFGNGYFGTTAITSAGSNGNGLLFEYDVPSGHYGISTKNIASNS